MAVMKPAAAWSAQIDHYRRLTGEQRLEIALDLHEMACDVAREGISVSTRQACGRVSNHPTSSTLSTHGPH